VVKKFRELTAAEIKKVCNGCGAKGGWIKPPDFIYEDSCQHHDYNYYLGFTEEHRKKADKQFYEDMRRQIKEVNILRRPALHVVAYGYYRAVRWYGEDSFYYGDKEQEL
jgi:hypothetical protein